MLSFAVLLYTVLGYGSREKMTRKQKDIQFIKISQNTEQFRTEHFKNIKWHFDKITIIVILPSYKSGLGLGLFK